MKLTRDEAMQLMRVPFNLILYLVLGFITLTAGFPLFRIYAQVNDGFIVEGSAGFTFLWSLFLVTGMVFGFSIYSSSMCGRSADFLPMARVVYLVALVLHLVCMAISVGGVCIVIWKQHSAEPIQYCIAFLALNGLAFYYLKKKRSALLKTVPTQD